MTQVENPYDRKIRILDDPKRIASLPQEELLSLVTMTEDVDVLDIGAGTGYLTLPIAEKTTGKVYALDLDEAILQFLNDKAQEEKQHNIELVHGDFMAIPLANQLVEIAFASLSLHEVTSLEIALQEIHRVLKEDGQFLCVEYEPKDDSNKRRVPSVEMEQGLITAGFEIIEKIFPTAQFLDQDIYIIVAKKK